MFWNLTFILSIIIISVIVIARSDHSFGIVLNIGEFIAFLSKSTVVDNK
jgi:hypothetical protein